jgi:hypothetical protein
MGSLSVLQTLHLFIFFSPFFAMVLKSFFPCPRQPVKATIEKKINTALDLVYSENNSRHHSLEE